MCRKPADVEQRLRETTVGDPRARSHAKRAELQQHASSLHVARSHERHAVSCEQVIDFVTVQFFEQSLTVCLRVSFQNMLDL